MVGDPRQNRVALIHGEKLRLKHTETQQLLVDDAKEAAYLALLYWGLQARVVWAMDPTSCSCCS